MSNAAEELPTPNPTAVIQLFISVPLPHLSVAVQYLHYTVQIQARAYSLHSHPPDAELLPSWTKRQGSQFSHSPSTIHSPHFTDAILEKPANGNTRPPHGSLPFSSQRCIPERHSWRSLFSFSSFLSQLILSPLKRLLPRRSVPPH
ncbi:hypothetical protein BT67DRAFT_155750 [Trichocladium antarcticum]|uniref:Uncharacterized protein n=1 Tax=Trichocladium antarcticum TaxID=1450529 RepID=A0AAN6UED2_9PEZI|nr:hypothetical protein BT67DRAFT_155750 [Trichocladium antarcticum]